MTVDAKAGITIGISAFDRAHTIGLLADATTVPGDLTRPGQAVPLRAREGGVLCRAGDTEASIDLIAYRRRHEKHAVRVAQAVNNDRNHVPRNSVLRESTAQANNVPGASDVR